MRFYCVFKIQKFIHSIEYHLFKILFLFTMSSGKFEFLSSAQSVWFLEDLCCLYFFSKLLKDQIITCIRRNERNYNSSGISASKVSLTIVYLRRTKVHNKLHNYYKWTIRKITHLKLFDTPTNKFNILHMFITLLIYMHVVLLVFVYLCTLVHL